jgi:hypothetical protein
MERIKYKFLSSEINLGAEDAPIINQFFIEKDFQYSEDTLKAVKAEAYNGVYEIYDDGQPEPTNAPSQLDIIEAQVTYTAMMTDTLLEV